MDLNNIIGNRIVLTCKNNLSFAGVLVEKTDYKKESIIVELDNASGFSILCPVDYVKKIVEIPIENQG